MQAATHRAGFVRALEGAQNLIPDGVLALRHGIEPGGHAQKSTYRSGAVPHARPYMIGIFRGADERGAEQFRGPGWTLGRQHPLDSRAALDAHDASDFCRIEQLLRRSARVGIEYGERRAHRRGRLAITQADESQRDHGGVS
jgi:hypothetical protein